MMEEISFRMEVGVSGICALARVRSAMRQKGANLLTCAMFVVG